MGLRVWEKASFYAFCFLTPAEQKRAVARDGKPFSPHPLPGTWRGSAHVQGLGPGCRGGQPWDLHPREAAPAPAGQAGQSDALTATCLSCCAAQAYREFGLEGCKAFKALTFYTAIHPCVPSCRQAGGAVNTSSQGVNR